MWPRICALVVVASLALANGSIVGQGKDFQAMGEVKVHKVELTQGELYRIKVTSTTFQPMAMIQPGFLAQPFRPAEFGKAQQERAFEATFMPQRTQTHTIAVAPGFGGLTGDGALLYELKVTRIVLAMNPLLKKEEALTVNDERVNLKNFFRKGHHKAYTVPMKAGQTYVIEMIRKDNNVRMDPYLILEDPGKQIVAQDDDGAGNLNSRIVFQATAAGDYRVIATTLGDDQVGEFTLTVRESVKD